MKPAPSSSFNGAEVMSKMAWEFVEAEKSSPAIINIAPKSEVERRIVT